jgi:hypothetical protein
LITGGIIMQDNFMEMEDQEADPTNQDDNVSEEVVADPTNPPADDEGVKDQPVQSENAPQGDSPATAGPGVGGGAAAPATGGSGGGEAGDSGQGGAADGGGTGN